MPLWGSYKQRQVNKSTRAAQTSKIHQGRWFHKILKFALSLHVNSHFFRWTWVSRYQNVSILEFVGAMDDGAGGDKWSYKTGKTPVKSLPPTNQHPTLESLALSGKNSVTNSWMWIIIFNGLLLVSHATPKKIFHKNLSTTSSIISKIPLTVPNPKMEKIHSKNSYMWIQNQMTPQI